MNPSWNWMGKRSENKYTEWEADHWKEVFIRVQEREERREKREERREREREEKNKKNKTKNKKTTTTTTTHTHKSQGITLFLPVTLHD